MSVINAMLTRLDARGAAIPQGLSIASPSPAASGRMHWRLPVMVLLGSAAIAFAAFGDWPALALAAPTALRQATPSGTLAANAHPAPEADMAVAMDMAPEDGAPPDATPAAPQAPPDAPLQMVAAPAPAITAATAIAGAAAEPVSRTAVKVAAAGGGDRADTAPRRDRAAQRVRAGTPDKPAVKPSTKAAPAPTDGVQIAALTPRATPEIPPAAPAAEPSLPPSLTPPVVMPPRIDKRPSAQSAGQKAAVLYRQAVDQAQIGQRQTALGLARQALSLDSRSAPVRLLAAVLEHESGAADRAAVLLRDGLALHPRDGAQALLLARILVAQGAGRDALAVLDAHEVAGVDADGLRGGVYARLGDFKPSLAAYERAARAQPANPMWWFGLGVALDSEGFGQRARQAYVRAQSIGLPRGELTAYAEQRIAALD